MPEWVWQSGTVVAVIFVIVKLGLDFAKWYIIWRAKKRNDGKVPEKLDRRSGETVGANPGNTGNALVIAQLVALEKILCLKLDGIQKTVTEIRKEK